MEYSPNFFQRPPAKAPLHLDFLPEQAPPPLLVNEPVEAKDKRDQKADPPNTLPPPEPAGDHAPLASPVIPGGDVHVDLELTGGKLRSVGVQAEPALGIVNQNEGKTSAAKEVRRKRRAVPVGPSAVRDMATQTQSDLPTLSMITTSPMRTI